MVVKSISEKPFVQEAVHIAFIREKHSQIWFNERDKDAIFVKCPMRVVSKCHSAFCTRCSAVESKMVIETDKEENYW